jgi:hypothetical protein
LTAVACRAVPTQPPIPNRWPVTASPCVLPLTADGFRPGSGAGPGGGVELDCVAVISTMARRGVARDIALCPFDGPFGKELRTVKSKKDTSGLRC